MRVPRYLSGGRGRGSVSCCVSRGRLEAPPIGPGVGVLCAAVLTTQGVRRWPDSSTSSLLLDDRSKTLMVWSPLRIGSSTGARVSAWRRGSECGPRGPAHRGACKAAQSGTLVRPHCVVASRLPSGEKDTAMQERGDGPVARYVEQARWKKRASARSPACLSLSPPSWRRHRSWKPLVVLPAGGMRAQSRWAITRHAGGVDWRSARHACA